MLFSTLKFLFSFLILKNMYEKILVKQSNNIKVYGETSEKLEFSFYEYVLFMYYEYRSLSVIEYFLILSSLSPFKNYTLYHIEVCFGVVQLIRFFFLIVYTFCVCLRFRHIFVCLTRILKFSH